MSTLKIFFESFDKLNLNCWSKVEKCIKQIYSELGLTETTAEHLQLCKLKELWMKSSHVKKIRFACSTVKT